MVFGCAILNGCVNKFGVARTEYFQEEQCPVILKIIPSPNTVLCMALVEWLFSLRHLTLFFAVAIELDATKHPSCRVVAKLTFHPYLTGRCHFICLCSDSSLTNAFKIKFIDDKSIFSDIKLSENWVIIFQTESSSYFEEFSCKEDSLKENWF